MQETISTGRLNLRRLQLKDAAFVKELVNTSGWKRFIGERNVHTLEDAEAYIQKIITSPAIHYWIINTRAWPQPVGIVSFIKRHYLAHWDIGFALLPEHSGNGYAIEAAMQVLHQASQSGAHSQFQATVLPSNYPSRMLLEKSGFGLEKEITHQQETLLLYSAPAHLFKQLTTHYS